LLGTGRLTVSQLCFIVVYLFAVVRRVSHEVLSDFLASRLRLTTDTATQ